MAHGSIANGSIARGKPRPPVLRALGRDEPPPHIEIDGVPHTRLTIFKHDSMAATALYESPAGERVVCKFGRTQPIFIVPMAWSGRLLARHEAKLLRLLADLPVPVLLGPVTIDGKPARHAFARGFIEGHPLARYERVNDEFFTRLKNTIEAMHQRRIAYVDLHKRENIIVDAEGRPHLIDFQISFVLPRGILGWPMRWLLWLFKVGDWHHLRKHMHRHRLDLLPPNAQSSGFKLPLVIRCWRCLATPFRQARRLLLVIAGVRKGRGRATTEFEPEDAVMREFAAPASVSPTTGYDSAECSHSQGHH